MNEITVTLEGRPQVSNDTAARRDEKQNYWFPIIHKELVSGQVFFYYIDTRKRIAHLTSANGEFRILKNSKDNDLQIEENIKALKEDITEIKNIIKHGNIKVKVLSEGNTKVTDKSSNSKI